VTTTPPPRALLSAVYHAAVQGAAPFPRTRDAVRDWFAARPTLPAHAPVVVIALGKAAPAMMAGALDAVASLGRVVHSGLIVAAHHASPDAHAGSTGVAVLPPQIRVMIGDHPVPGPASLDAADALESLVHELEPGTIAIVLLSGGTTSLCAAPIAALSQAVGDAERAQAHLANLAQTLLESGLAIHEMNAIRRRVLRWGAGRLAVALVGRGAAHVPVFAISDVIGDDPAVIGSGPCTADPLDDATFLALLDAHDMRARVERAMGVVLGLEGAGHPPVVPSASHPAFERVGYTLVARNRDAVQAMADHARATGITALHVQDAPLEGDAAQLGDSLARLALQMAHQAPQGTSLLLCGGEPVVNLRETIDRALARGEEDDLLPAGSSLPVADEPLRGGRMQVLALSAALALEEAAHGDPAAWRITVLAAGTDGRDGPTDAAGAIVDAAVPGLARRAGRSPEADLATGRSWLPLDAADALLRPGPTGTNVMDVVALLIRDGTRG
jgi:hydroxypyruvate reductase